MSLCVPYPAAHRLSGNAVRLLILIDQMNYEQKATSIPAICTHAAVSPITAGKLLRELETAGLIERSARYTDNRARLPNRISVLVDGATIPV